MSTCQWCGDTFEQPHRKGPKPKFCSASHRQAAFQKRDRLRLIDKALEAGSNDVQVMLRMPPELIEACKARARIEGRTLPSMIRQVMRTYVAQ